MKWSEAIREGIKKDGVQTFNALFQRDPKGKIVGCCALGAAAIGAGVPPDEAEDSTAAVGEALGGVYASAIHIPKEKIPADLLAYFEKYNYSLDQLGNYYRQLDYIIVRLNDSMRWSREKIADWVESVGY